jgi:hypothetical protein
MRKEEITMRRISRKMPGGRAAASDRDMLPDGIGGTITGAPAAPIDLMEILGRGSRDASRGGAVSGAAHVVVSSVPGRSDLERDIALSDGSRISFTSFADAGVLRHEGDRVLRRDEARHLQDA